MVLSRACALLLALLASATHLAHCAAGAPLQWHDHTNDQYWEGYVRPDPTIKRMWSAALHVRGTITANGTESQRTCFPQYTKTTPGVLRANVVVSFGSKAVRAHAHAQTDGLRVAFNAVPEFLELDWFPPGYESGSSIVTISMHLPGLCSFSHTRRVGFPTGPQGWEVGVEKEDWGLLSDTTLGEDVVLVLVTSGPGANTKLLSPPSLPAPRLWCAVCDVDPPCGLTRGPMHVCPANGTRGGGRGGCGCPLPPPSTRLYRALARAVRLALAPVRRLARGLLLPSPPAPLLLALSYAAILPFTTIDTLAAALTPLASPDAGVRGSASLAALGVAAWMAVQAACARARACARERARRAAAVVQMQPAAALKEEEEETVELLSQPEYSFFGDALPQAAAGAMAPAPAQPTPVLPA